jgi:hypothetical protein
MKKVILALAIVSVSFAACNSGESTETPKVDTPAVAAPVEAAPVAPVDTTAPAAPVDTTKK